MSSVPLLERAGAACGPATELEVKTAEFLVIWNSAFWLQEGKNGSGRGGMDPGLHSRVFFAWRTDLGTTLAQTDC